MGVSVIMTIEQYRSAYNDGGFANAKGLYEACAEGVDGGAEKSSSFEQ